jgi:small subunit ribosomal protein S7
MPRKARAYKKHPVDPDHKYNSIKVAKFINYIMERGKKTVARKIVYDSFDIIQEKIKKDPKEVFETAIKNVAPVLEVKGRRIGGANYQVPIEVTEPRKTTLSMRWILAAAKSKKGKRMALRVAEELMEAYQKLGTAMKKREDVHKMAEANKAFAHFARFQRRK